VNLQGIQRQMTEARMTEPMILDYLIQTAEEPAGLSNPPASFTVTSASPGLRKRSIRSPPRLNRLR
jgi:hypothetical protein